MNLHHIKTHYTSLAIIPPSALWEPIQIIRREHDRQVARWMPHINLLYPFWPEERFADTVPILKEICSGIVPFDIALREFRHFDQGGDRHMMYLAPEPEKPIHALQTALLEKFPECVDTARHSGGFVPHMNVGQATTEALEPLLATLRMEWKPLTFMASSVALLARSPGTPFQVKRIVAMRVGSGIYPKTA